MRLRPLVSIIAAATIALAPAARSANDLNSQMNDMFNGLGAVGNVTQPGAFRGQAMNYAIGGNIMMRAPGRNYQLANIQLPSIKAGCGGIDVFGGSFSFINKDQFIALLKNIGANALGYAFNLALCSISPDICNQLKYLQDQLAKINNMNINSCQAAQQLVDGVVGAFSESKRSQCENVSQYDGSAADREEAIENCNSNATAKTNIAAASTDPNLRNAGFTQGNVVWEAMKQVPWLTREERELLMSIAGTTIVTPPPSEDQGPAVTHVPPTITAMKDILLGDADLGNGAITVNILTCDEAGTDPVNCWAPTPQPATIQTFQEKVRATLTHISDNIRNRNPQTAEDIGFINLTGEPVYLLLSTDNARRDSSLADSHILQYKDVIALEYVETLLTVLMKDVRMALAKSPARSKVEAEYVREIADNVARANQQILLEKQTAYTRVANLRVFAQQVREIQTAMWGNLPVAVKAMLDFANAPSGSKL